MDKLIAQFVHYLSADKNFSERTIRAYELDLQKFTAFLESRNITDISNVARDDIRAFLSELTLNGIKKPNSAVTRARKLSSIKSFYKYLVRYGVLEANPAADVETPKLPHKEPNYLTPEEYDALLLAVRRAATPFYLARDLAIVTTFLNTGVRLSELVGLTLHSINLQSSNAFIKVRGKGDKERTIPLNENVAATLRKYVEKRPEVDTNQLFISRVGKGLGSRSVYHLIKRYLKEAGIKKERIGVHSLRHTFGASLLAKNVNLVVIQELLGHKKLETTRRYLHINSVDLRNAVDRLVLDTQP